MIYRVTKKTTGSVQPGSGCTFWNRETIYCGTDLEEARVAFLGAKNGEYGGGYGNRACEVEIEQFASEPDDIDDTSAAEVEEIDAD